MKLVERGACLPDKSTQRAAPESIYQERFRTGIAFARDLFANLPFLRACYIQRRKNQGGNATWKVVANLESFCEILNVSRKSEHFPDHLETFQTIWIFSPAIRKLSRPSGNFPDYLEKFQANWKHSRPFGFPPRPSGNFPCHLETFLAIWKLSRIFRNFPGYRTSFQVI